jgi:hypothetical protein
MEDLSYGMMQTGDEKITPPTPSQHRHHLSKVRKTPGREALADRLKSDTQ